MWKQKKSYDKNSYHRAPKQHIAVEAYNDNKFESPSKPKYEDGSATLNNKAFRDLQNIGVIDVKADPNAELSYGSFPYTIIGKTCPVLDASYPGADNIDGNTIVMIQNDTTKSKLMNTFDAGVVVKTINYCYLPIRDSDVNLAMAGEMIKSIEQAVSFGWSTMLTQLPFFSSTYASAQHDLPIPTAQANSKAAGYYKVLIHYQCVLQALVAPISKYIELRSLEKELMRMSFRTEAPLITQLFGLFKKSSFIAEINTIGTVVLNEYFDKNWYQQTCTLCCVPSRKTKGMADPLLTLIGIHAIPDITIDSTVYNSASVLSTGATAALMDPDTFTISQGAVKLQELVTRICKLLNPAYILKFVRLMNRGLLPTGEGKVSTISAYAEQVKIMMSFIAAIAAAFSTNMSNVRTVLDKLSQSNLVYWTKGVPFFVDKIAQLEPHYNALLADVFKAAYSGADKVTYDSDTKRWRAWALRNKYEGIPEFDKRSGGSFLTFGLRQIVTTGLDMESSTGLIPIAFGSGQHDSKCMIVNRMGAALDVTSIAITDANVNANAYLARLNPLSTTALSVKAPEISFDTLNDASHPNKDAILSSALLQFIDNVFGYGNVKITTPTPTQNHANPVDQGTTPTGTDATPVDPVVYSTMNADYVAFLDIEISDVSNQIITYCRNYAPFRVDTPNGDRTIGFTR